MMRFLYLTVIILMPYFVIESHCKRVNIKRRKNIHTFETRVPNSKQNEQSEKYEIIKREGELIGSASSLKRHDITHRRREKGTHRNALKTPKNIIESANGFNHLSELLGLKGSFIPSQSRQRWVENEGEKDPAPDDDDFNSIVRQLERHGHMNMLSTMKGTLPLDITPQQARLITSTADSNSQRRKFLQWEKEGGSMDTRHFPSTYIKGNGHVEGGIDIDASKRVSTGEVPSHDKSQQPSRGFQGADDTSIQSDKLKMLLKKAGALNEAGNKEKKGFLGFSSNQLGMADLDHAMKNELSNHAFLGTAFRTENEQPLTHEMINKLQLDPAWDAMEAKILAQNGRRVVPMPLPVSKIDREMMPPLGEPVGQAYLPRGRKLHTDLVSNFHKAAGFMSQPLREDLHSSSYYSHFQPTDQGSPQTINVGGSLVHAVSDPWKNLKQLTYDHADDNFPLASVNQQLPAQSGASSALATADQGSDVGMESVGTPLTKVKGKLFKEKESSKAITSKNDEGGLDIKIGKGNLKKKPNLVLVKGKKFGKMQSSRDDDNDDSDDVKENKMKFDKERKIRPNSRLKDGSTDDGDKVVEAAKPSEDTDEDIKDKGRKGKSQKESFHRFENSDEGPRFSQQESNNQEKQPIRAEGQPGKNADRSRARQNQNTGRYITHKFVSFLSDVAKHLNVDKLSIAEQLVQDVEESKRRKTRSDALKLSENKAINDLLQRLQTKRRKVASQHANLKTAKEDEIGGLKIRRKQPTVIKYIWNKGISVLKETR